MLLHHIFRNKEFSALFENAVLGVIIVNKEGQIVAANKHVYDEFGYLEPELDNQSMECLIPGRLHDIHKQHRLEYYKNPLSKAVCLGLGVDAVRKDGTEFKVEVSLGHYTSKEGEYFIAFINDLTKKLEADKTIQQLKGELDQRVKESTRSLHATVDQLSRQIKENERKDAELIKALENEKEMNALKSRFVSIASHEFRTPLSGILASTYLLSKYTKESDQPQRDKHIKRILSSANLLNEVLSDFLSVDKMEQENFRPNPTLFDIGVLVTEIIQNLQHMLKPGQEIDYNQECDNDIAFLDTSMLHHILTNLLSNAIKYSPENSKIELSVVRKSDDCILRVKDHGIGIPQPEQENLYKRFFRSTNAAHIQGTGLGLNIVKKYVDVLDGTIDCKSEENKGTEFIVRFKNQKVVYENHISSGRQ